jgi:heme-degrading monooxygenase HmoA
MLLQVLSFEEDAAALDEGARHVREEVVPSIQGAEGLLAAYWAVGRENGKRVSIMVWESAEAAGAAMPSVVEAIKRRRHEAGRTTPQASPTSVERFEVIAHVSN